MFLLLPPWRNKVYVYVHKLYSPIYLSSVLVTFVDDNGGVVRCRGCDSGRWLTSQSCRSPRACTADQCQRHNVDKHEQKEEERASELSAAVDLVETVGADETWDGAQVAVYRERIGGGVEVGRGDDERNKPRADDDATCSTLSLTVAGARQWRQRRHDREITAHHQSLYRTLISFTNSDNFTLPAL